MAGTDVLILRVLDMAMSVATMASYIQRASVILQRVHVEGGEISDAEWTELDKETNDALEKFDSLIADKSHE